MILRLVYFAALWLLFAVAAVAQPTAPHGSLPWLSALREPMPLDTTRAVENRMFGFTLLRDDTVARCLTIHCPSVTGKRPKGPANDPDYATFGSRSVIIPLKQHDLSLYNFIEAEIFPAKPNTGVVNINLSLDTREPQTVGAHLWNLRPDRWNRVICQITDYNRRNVSAITLYTDLKGSSYQLAGDMRYIIRNVRLQRRQGRLKTQGWQPDTDAISYCHSGYLPHMRKQAIINARWAGCPFTIVKARGQIACKGTARQVNTSIGSFAVCDFTSLNTTGTYRLSIGDMETDAFSISPTTYVPATWRLLNYIFCQRCGYEVPGIHAACHADLFATRGSRTVSYSGGWHDAGDLSQQTLQTADVAFALLEYYDKAKASDTLLAARLLDEARWGLRFILQTRLGDGYRASSMGLLHWTDGIAGTDDDIHTVRQQNNSFDNFLYAACEAYAATVLPQAVERQAMREAAEADYAAALHKYLKQGIDSFPHMMEHTYATPPSLYMAAASWASSMLYSLTADSAYARHARRFIDYVLRCQETSAHQPIQGFFYRDNTRRSITHFIHQSRSQLYAQALTALCLQQPSATEKTQWDNALRLYASYIRHLAPYTAPYGMLPSGIYQENEYADSAAFARLHLFAPPDARRQYDAQLHAAVSLGKGKYLRRFPIWFSIFNGNQAVILSAGKAAAILGSYLHDRCLTQIATDQLTWTLGQNPFCQSLVYGEGHDYASMDSFSSGEIMGATPVGIRSIESQGNHDEPYWSTINNACYKEVWATAAGKLLSLMAELTAEEP